MSRWRSLNLALLAAAVVLLALTFARPMMDLEQPTFRYVYVFDISQSMNVLDVPGHEGEVSRLDYAKQTAIDSLSRLPCGSELGLALFTGHRAFLLITPIETCANYRELSAMIDNISWRMTWKPRSEIAKGLFKSLSLLDDFERPTRLAFFTDGHEAPPLNPDLSPTFAGTENDITGMLVGVGGDDPVPIPKFDKFGEPQGYWGADEVMHIDAYTQSTHARDGTTSTVTGTEHLSSLREQYLQQLAASTGLGYFRIRADRDFAGAVTSRELSLPRTLTSDVRWVLAVVALAAFLGSCVWRPRVGASRPGRTRTAGAGSGGAATGFTR